MGSRSRVDWNHRCTDRGPARLHQTRTLNAVGMLENPAAFNNHDRRAARSIVRRAVKRVIHTTIPEFRNAFERRVLGQFGHLYQRRIY